MGPYAEPGPLKISLVKLGWSHTWIVKAPPQFWGSVWGEVGIKNQSYGKRSLRISQGRDTSFLGTFQKEHTLIAHWLRTSPDLGGYHMLLRLWQWVREAVRTEGKTTLSGCQSTRVIKLQVVWRAFDLWQTLESVRKMMKWWLSR